MEQLTYAAAVNGSGRSGSIPLEAVQTQPSGRVWWPSRRKQYLRLGSRAVAISKETVLAARVACGGHLEGNSTCGLGRVRWPSRRKQYLRLGSRAVAISKETLLAAWVACGGRLEENSTCGLGRVRWPSRWKEYLRLGSRVVAVSKKTVLAAWVACGGHLKGNAPLDHVTELGLILISDGPTPTFLDSDTLLDTVNSSSRYSIHYSIPFNMKSNTKQMEYGKEITLKVSTHQTWGAAQQVVMKGLYEEGTQDVVTLSFQTALNGPRTEEPTAREQSTLMDSEWTSHSTRRATARRGRAQPTAHGEKGEGEWANHAARGPKKISDENSAQLGESTAGNRIMDGKRRKYQVYNKRASQKKEQSAIRPVQKVDNVTQLTKNKGLNTLHLISVRDDLLKGSNSPLNYNGGAVVAMQGHKCVAIASDKRLGVQAQTVSSDFEEKDQGESGWNEISEKCGCKSRSDRVCDERGLKEFGLKGNPKGQWERGELRLFGHIENTGMDQKMFPMGPRTYLGLTGLATDIKTCHDKLKFRLNLYNLREGRDMHPKTFASIVSNMLYEKSPLVNHTNKAVVKIVLPLADRGYHGVSRMGPPAVFLTGPAKFPFKFGSHYLVEPVVAGLDPLTFKPYVVNMDIIGCLSEPGSFVVAGTCSRQLYGLCEALWEPDLGPDDLFERISQALVNSCDRDAISGCGVVVHLIEPDKITTKHVKTRMD
uniref:Proteasome subunit beta type-3 n=1 Tax=Timema shepardi TaxID=629360 RepID=A0A7R9AZC8_TIMSH|nr:unnamed protein product [Timema shepardi]